MTFSQLTHLLMCFSLETLMSIIITGQYSGGTNTPGELCYNFSITYDLTQMVILPTWIPVILTIVLFLISFFWCNYFFYNGFSSMWPSFDPFSVSIDFQLNSKQDAPLYCTAYDHSCVDLDSLHDYFWDIFHGKISLNLLLLLLLVNFVSRFRLEVIYISHIISIRSSLTHLHGFQLHVLLP